MTSRLRLLAPLAVAALALAACAATPKPVAPVTLTFASWVFISDEQRAFMDEVKKNSHGAITFKVIENWTEPDGVEKPSDEIAMAQAIAADKIDMGWTSTRSFPALGIDGFRAIEAPFLIQNYAGAVDIATGPVGTDALRALGSAGLTGLAAYPGSLRFPLTNGAPLLQPSDWAGKQIDYYGAPNDDSVQTRTIRALGGTPVYYPGVHTIDDLVAGHYDGATDSLGDVAAGGATPHGPYVSSNVILWPTLAMFIGNTKKLASLTASQRAVIAAAARHAVRPDLATSDDPTIGQDVCSTTARFGTATPEQLMELRSAVQPVYDWLQDSPAEAPNLARLQAIAAAHPVPDAVTVPSGCGWSPSTAG